MKYLYMTVFALIVNIGTAAAGQSNTEHSGGTDNNGCHVDHQTGQRHCH